MTSKDRILNTVYRKPVDRVPISMYELSQFKGSSCASFANEEPSYQNILSVMAQKTDCLMMSDPVFSYPYIEKITEIKRHKEGISTYEEKILHTPKGDLTSKTRIDDNIFTLWTLEHFLKDEDDIEKYMSLDFTCKVDTSKMLQDKEMIGENGIILPSISDPICNASELFAMEEFLILAITQTDIAQNFLDWLYEGIEQNLRTVLKSDVSDMMFRIVGPEYATPPYLQDQYYNSFVTQYAAKMTRMIKDAGAIPRIHSHGNVKYALSQLVNTDMMCIDPVEPIPDGNISLKEVKQLYGDKLTIMGNIELKELEIDSPEQIDALVKSVMEDAKEGGGFILMPTATPINLPLSKKTEENMIAMIEAGHKYGQY